MLSWSMLFLGTASFVSCDDDDDDDNKGVNVSEVYKKYSGKQGTTVDGDNVVYVLGNSVTVYHFSGDKLSGATCYVDCMSAETAKKMAEEYEAKADGQYMYYELDEEELADYKDMKKDDLVKDLKATDDMFSFE